MDGTCKAAFSANRAWLMIVDARQKRFGADIITPEKKESDECSPDSFLLIVDVILSILMILLKQQIHR